MPGQGEDSTAAPKEQLLRYFQRINRGLQSVLRGERAPLVLAGVEHLLPIYRKVNTYAHVLDQGVVETLTGWEWRHSTRGPGR
ncbi:MAG: hypothetical protein ABI456_01165 [Ktedonobacteraceae bacterium]